ncbi:hypothetical protein [Rhizobium leguminosarum]|uniref:hypothetical protein n=1 Tax=Rhizobium leguminosarum TaxID=384 RepID=UPI001C92177E|nr:hypothetical protein [Rhizobium leguminosarum]MBY2986667.1 hypothetical protein [Rhizobium leguminosarum]
MRFLIGQMIASAHYPHLTVAFASQQVIGNHENIAKEIKSLLEESSKAFREAGYAAGSLRSFNSNVGQAMRLFTTELELPDIGRFVIRADANKGTPPDNRKNRGSKRDFIVFDWGQISNYFSPDLVDDIAALDCSVADAMSIRSFLTSLVMGSSSSPRLASVFAGRVSPVEGDVAIIKNCLIKLGPRLEKDAGLQQTTIRTRQNGAARVLERLSRRFPQRYPVFAARTFKVRYVSHVSLTLGSLDLGVPESLTGAARQREALRIVRDAAMTELRQERSIFDKLQEILGSTVDADAHTDVHTWQAASDLRLVLTAERESYAETGFGQFHLRGKRRLSSDLDDAMRRLKCPSAWYAAGLREVWPHNRDLNRSDIDRILARGLGATARSVAASMIVFCCETGWNKQPTQDLPREVFFYEFEGEHLVGSLLYVASFKKRAGHEVKTLIERSSTEISMLRDKVLGLWDQVERSEDWGANDHRASLPCNSEASVALEMIRPMVEAARVYSSSHEIGEKFFANISREGGIVGDVDTIRRIFTEGILSTDGLTFRAIRGSFEQLKLREVGSVEGLRPFAGHVGTNVLQRHYLNSDDVTKEQAQSIRFFQNAVQALVVAAGGIMLKLPNDLHEWFFNLAQASGVAGAIGFGASSPRGPPGKKFCFEPTDAGIVDLVSVHLALKHAKRTWDRYRWSVQGAPLAGFVVALERRLREAGLSSLFRAKARETIFRHRAGEISLPRLF